MIAESVVKESFASASSPMKKKDIPRLSHDSRSDLVKGSLLIQI